MTKSQKLQLRLSEIRQKLNALSGKDELTAEERAEMEALATEFGEKETEYRAAIIAEAGEIEERRAELDAAANAGGETAEVRMLRQRTSLGHYLAPAATGRPLQGEAAELNDALEVRAGPGQGGGVIVPWDMLEVRDDPRRGRVEHRQDVATTSAELDGGTMQRPILQRLFGRDILAALGIRIDSVPAGMTEYPILTGGVSPAMTAEGAAKNAEQAAFSTQSLKPKRLTGRYRPTVEQLAQVPDLEMALRRDLADSVLAQMSNQAINGDGAGVNVTGFLSRLAAPDAPAEVASYSDYAGVHAQAVDGVHAVSESEVSSVIGVASYKHAASVYQAGSGESGTESMMKRSGGCQASNFIPAVSAKVQDGNILHAGMDPMRGDSIAAVWSGGIELIRDIYTGAAEGEVILTWITLWDLHAAFRAAAYKRVAFKLEA